MGRHHDENLSEPILLPDHEQPVGTEPTGFRGRVYAVNRWALLRIGRRGAALLYFGVLDVVYAFSLFLPAPEQRRSSAIRFLAEVAPLWLWGVAWSVAAVLCLVCVFRVNDRVGFAAAISIKMLWGTLYLVGWLVAGVERAWLSATLWLCLAGFIGIIASWPEPPIRILRR